MAWITLEEAKKNLQLWLEASQAVAAGQSYTIGTRSLTRASLRQIMDMIAYWRKEVAALEAAETGRSRVYRGVPRDL